MVVGARQSVQFFRQKTWFLGNYKKLVRKDQFQISHASCSFSYIFFFFLVFQKLKDML